MRLNGLDLNLLVALDVLLEEQQVTRAGERVGLTRSAMSDALARLRRHYGAVLAGRSDRAPRPPGRSGVRVGIGAGVPELGVDRLLLQLPLETLTVDDLPESVGRLIAPASGPDLPATVEAYLDCGADGQETARHLRIHRSSLYYRLDRVREVAGVDLRDGAVRRELHTGLRVARLAGLW